MALEYANRGWRVFPVGAHKKPLSPHGHLDATCDESKIRSWWSRQPDALIAIGTGEVSGVVALDIDIREHVNGFDSLEAIGVAFHPISATTHTPSGGCHGLFLHPGRFVKTTAGRLGPGLDIRGDGGSLIMPPASRRWWDPHLGLNTPIAKMPAWMATDEADNRTDSPVPRSACQLSRYAEVALDNAIRRIIEAPEGAQEVSLNRGSYSVGCMVAAGIVPAGLALESLHWAAANLANYDQGRPWQSKALSQKVTNAFAAGLRSSPRPRRG
jgi:hypothetical protein